MYRGECGGMGSAGLLRVRVKEGDEEMSEFVMDVIIIEGTVRRGLGTRIPKRWP